MAKSHYLLTLLLTLVLSQSMPIDCPECTYCFTYKDCQYCQYCRYCSGGPEDIEISRFRDFEQREPVERCDSKDYEPIAGPSDNLVEMATKKLEAPQIDVKTIDSLDREGRTLLMEAAADNDTVSAQKLISSGANINRQGDTGVTALHIACGTGNMEMVKLLVSEGADINLATFDESQIDFTKYEKYLHPILRDPRLNHETPLWTAVRYNRIEIVKYLISKGADVKTRVSSGRTLIAMSSAMGNLFVTRILLENGCNPNEVDHKGFDAWSSCEPSNTDFSGYDKSSGSEMARRKLIYYEFLKAGHLPNLLNPRLTSEQELDIEEAKKILKYELQKPLDSIDSSGALIVSNPPY